MVLLELAIASDGEFFFMQLLLCTKKLLFKINPLKNRRLTKRDYAVTFNDMKNGPLTLVVIINLLLISSGVGTLL